MVLVARNGLQPSGEMPMNRAFGFVLPAAIAVLVSGFSIQAQQKDPPKNFTNSIGMKFVWIPSGNFMMGSPKEEKDRGANEAQHKVTLTKGYYIGIDFVT